MYVNFSTTNEFGCARGEYVRWGYSARLTWPSGRKFPNKSNPPSAFGLENSKPRFARNQTSGRASRGLAAPSSAFGLGSQSRASRGIKPAAALRAESKSNPPFPGHFWWYFRPDPQHGPMNSR